MKNKLVKRIIVSFLEKLGYQISYSDKVLEPEFEEIYKKCKSYTMTSKERMYALYNAVNYILKNKIKGDFIECGVWKGGSTMLIAHTLLKRNHTKRKIFLYDTYEGMPKPTEEDKKVNSKKIAKFKWEKKQKESFNKWCYASLEEVKKNMISTNYPESNLIFVKGKVENTIKKESHKNIALLRLDTDWYESTKHELINLYPKVSKNGVLILDDYGHWAGAKKAVDEYFKGKYFPLLNRIDYCGRIGIKTK